MSQTKNKAWKIMLLHLVSLFCFFLLFGIDQLSKAWAVSHLKDQLPRTFFHDWFELFYLENKGAAWGMLSGQTTFLIIITVVVLVAIFLWYAKIPYQKQTIVLKLSLIMIASGALGNMMDRILHHYVIDFLYVKRIDFQVFNIADIYVTLGAVLFVLAYLFQKEPEKSEEQS